MRFKSIKISNFRNFEYIDISLDNKNVFFGMNDVGKTNFLHALRYVFDRDIRKNNLVETDFYQRNTENPIEICISIDISDTTDPDSEKLRAKVKGAILSNQNLVYIKLVANFDKTEMIANPVLYWGGDEQDLQEIKARGYSFEIDYVFNSIYNHYVAVTRAKSKLIIVRLSDIHVWAGSQFCQNLKILFGKSGVTPSEVMTIA